MNIGNTAQALCGRCADRFFVRLAKSDAGLLAQVKEDLANMTEEYVYQATLDTADDVQRR